MRPLSTATFVSYRRRPFLRPASRPSLDSRRLQSGRVSVATKPRGQPLPQTVPARTEPHIMCAYLGPHLMPVMSERDAVLRDNRLPIPIDREVGIATNAPLLGRDGGRWYAPRRHEKPEESPRTPAEKP